MNYEIIDSHCHAPGYILPQEFYIDDDCYTIVNCIISIDPFVSQLKSKCEGHYSQFINHVDGVAVKCVDCNEILYVGTDPYRQYNLELIQKNAGTKARIFLMPAITVAINDELDYYNDNFKNKYHGIKLYTGTTGISLNEIGRINSNLPLLIHTGIQPNQHPKNMLQFISHYDGNICLAHFCRFYEDALKLVKTSDNLFIDISPANYMFERYIKQKHSGGLFDKSFNSAEEMVYRLIDLVGIDKILWGSDYPFSDCGKEIQIFNRLKLSPEEKKQIMYKNAKKFLGSN